MHIFGQQLLQTPLNCQLFLLKSWIYTQVNQRTTTTKKTEQLIFARRFCQFLQRELSNFQDHQFFPTQETLHLQLWPKCPGKNGKEKKKNTKEKQPNHQSPQGQGDDGQTSSIFMLSCLYSALTPRKLNRKGI